MVSVCRVVCYQLGQRKEEWLFSFLRLDHGDNPTSRRMNNVSLGFPAPGHAHCLSFIISVNILCHIILSLKVMMSKRLPLGSALPRRLWRYTIGTWRQRWPNMSIVIATGMVIADVMQRWIIGENLSVIAFCCWFKPPPDSVQTLDIITCKLFQKLPLITFLMTCALNIIAPIVRCKLF